MTFHLRVLHETSIKNTLFTVVQNRKFKTVKYTEDCPKQYITDRCWLIESGLGSTASISFPPPLPSLFLKHRMAHNGPWLLGIPDVSRDTVTLTPYPSAIPYSPFIFLWNMISFQFSTIHHKYIHISSLSFLLRYWAQKTHICFPVTSQVVKQAEKFMCACLYDILIWLVTVNKNQRIFFSFFYKSWYKCTKQVNKHDRNTLIYLIK